MKRAVITRERVVESQKADRIIGGKGVTFIGLRESHFEDDLANRGIENKIRNIITELNPVKIFTHSSDDAHQDHRATFRIVLRLHRRMRLKSDLYTFDVWHIINLKKRNKPKLVVDISDTFETKIKALKAFKSQFDLAAFYNYLTINNFLFFMVYVKDALNGIKNNTKYAEVFYKIR